MINQAMLFALILAIAFVICSGVLLTKHLVASRNRKALQERLENLVGSVEFKPRKNLLSESAVASPFPLIQNLEKLHEQANLKMPFADFLNIVLTLAAIIACLPLAFDLNFLSCLLLSVFLLAAAYAFLKQKAESSRNKFLLQLPNAIDLTVSILRSGHSIPQAVRSVAEESPAPLGDEFTRIFHRMNLGQSLSESLQATVRKYDSFELDLLRRATALNQELGGSLAEVLEKTNQTLRQRIKLRNQIGILTAQGKLSAIICGLLPLITAALFSQINPLYLQPLLDSNLGRGLLLAALALELAGFLIMRKLSSFRI